MTDFTAQIELLCSSSREDWEVGEDLIRRGSVRHGFFFLHLAIEKVLKALVCRNSGNIAPKTHNLVRLALLAELELTDEQKDFLAIYNQYNITGRYPDVAVVEFTKEESLKRLAETMEVYTWLLEL